MNNTLSPVCQCAHEAEAHVVVAILRPPIVPVTRAQVIRIVVPTAATYDAVRARYCGHHTIFNDDSKIDFLTDSEFTCDTWATTLPKE